MRTIGIYIRFNADDEAIEIQETALLKYAAQQGYDTYVSYYDKAVVKNAEDFFNTDTVQLMIHDIQTGIIQSALCRYIFLNGNAGYKSVDFNFHLDDKESRIETINGDVYPLNYSFIEE